MSTSKNKKPKERGKKVTMEVYQAMRNEYYRSQTIESVANACGVSPTTARKYVLKGDKTRSLPAIHDLWTSSQALALKEEGLTLASARTDHLKMTNQMLEKYQKAINALDPKKLNPQFLVTGFEKLVKLREQLLAPIADSSEKDRFDGYSVEELLEFFRTGVLPERDRANIPAPN